MPNLIRMQTDVLLEFVSQMNQVTTQMDSEIDSTLTLVKKIHWEGERRDRYVEDFQSLARQFHATTEEGHFLTTRLQREVEEWLSLDQRQGESCSAIIAALGGISAAINKFFNDVYSAILKKWQELKTIEERVEFLQKEHDKIAKKFGFSPVPVIAWNLKDPKGQDVLGLNTGSMIVIDTDNLKSDDPKSLLITVAHESRHQYQKACVEKYQQDGKIPSGMTKTQVEKWVYEEDPKNYIHPENDFEGYYDQAIETDAREFATEYVNEEMSD